VISPVQAAPSLQPLVLAPYEDEPDELDEDPVPTGAAVGAMGAATDVGVSTTAGATAAATDTTGAATGVDEELVSTGAGAATTTGGVLVVVGIGSAAAVVGGGGTETGVVGVAAT
jgi:hypothetical protein